MKYKLTENKKETLFGTLYQIQALKDFGNVEFGDLGGWISKEANLSQVGNSWVTGNARVTGNAHVTGNASVAKTKDYLVLKNNWSSGRYFTYTRSNKMWVVGCFYGTGEELIAKAYSDSELIGKCYEASVRYVEAIYETMEEE